MAETIHLGEIAIALIDCMDATTVSPMITDTIDTSMSVNPRRNFPAPPRIS